MMHLDKTKILAAKVDFYAQKFRTPLRLSSGLIETITEARATVLVKVGDNEAEGQGSIYLSDLWAWPGASPDRSMKTETMRSCCSEIANSISTLGGNEPAHPLELGLRLLHSTEKNSMGGMPLLAKAVCASPFDAAIHDAAGQATGLSSFQFYKINTAIPSADRYFQNAGAIQAIANTLRSPAKSLEGWWLVSAHDDLGGALAEAIHHHGFYCFKIKILGTDLKVDARRTAEVYRAAKRHGVSAPRLSVDSNEAHASPDAVLEYLERLSAFDQDAFAALQYLEQPTDRDIRRHAFDWGPVAAHKPVMLDEGLTGLDLLPLVMEQRWSGLALKTCKGHSFALTAAAWAHQHGLLLTMQDLTNPGLAAIHSYLFAAHLPVTNGIELNSPQFTPQANMPWLPELACLFEVRDGKHRLNPEVPGLGSNLGSSASIQSVLAD